MVVDGEALELVLHVYGRDDVLESALLAQLHGAHEWHTVTVWVVPVEIRVEGEQNVD